MYSLGDFLDAAAGMNTKPIPVRGSGSPRLPGSFPRVRGKHLLRAAADGVDGLIPARAGKTAWPGGCASPFPAHPRACGENIAWIVASAAAVGSSPRVRGKLSAEVGSAHIARLIPACAGKTEALRTYTSGLAAHPRACGENM